MGPGVHSVAAFIVAAAFLVALAVSVLQPDGPNPATVVGFGAVLAAWAVTMAWRPGVAVAAWVATYANMVPFLDIATIRISGVVRASDVLVLALGVAGLAVSLRGKVADSGTWRRRLLLLFMAMTVWWVLVLLGTVLMEGVPLSYAVAYGRDLLYAPVVGASVATVLTSATGAVRSMRLLTKLAAVFGAGFVLSMAVGVDPSWLAHPYQTVAVVGQTRYYVWGHLVVAMCLPVAFWAVFATSGWRRWLWSAATVFLAAELAVALWRANYLGAGLSIVTTLVLAASWRASAQLRRWAGKFVVVLVGLGLVLGLAHSLGMTVAAPAALRGATARSATLVGLAEGGHIPNLDFRLNLVKRMASVLGGDWLWGMGFLHPAVHPVSGMPGGSIRNTDISFSMVLMPMGAIGLALFLSLYVWVLVAAVRALKSAQDPVRAAALLGAAGAMVCVLSAGTTLVYWPWAGTVVFAVLALMTSLAARAPVSPAGTGSTGLAEVRAGRVGERPLRSDGFP